LQQEEQVQVRLVLVDVLVTDRSGRTVPGLVQEDFTLLVQNRPVEIDTLDSGCRAGAMEDPGPRSSGQPFQATAGDGRKRPFSSISVHFVAQSWHSRGTVVAQSHDFYHLLTLPRKSWKVLNMSKTLQDLPTTAATATTSRPSPTSCD
jgi:hypothetical protein